VKLPKAYNVKNPESQQLIRRGIESAWRKEATEYLPDRVEELAKGMGFGYRDVFIKNMKTRWGSCSKDNNINLNLHLMRLPDYLIDYVILHELVHTEVKNHSHKFWSLLDEVTANTSKKLDKELRNCSIQVW